MANTASSKSSTGADFNGKDQKAEQKAYLHRWGGGERSFLRQEEPK